MDAAAEACDGTLKRMHDALRDRARQKAGRHREPSAAVIDSQTSRARGAGGPDAGSTWVRIPSAARQMVEAAPAGDLPRLEQIWSGGACTGSFAAWLSESRGWRIEVPFHRPAPGLALRAGGTTQRLPRHSAPLDRRAHLRLALPIPASRPRPRAPALNRRRHDPRRHEPHNAPTHRVTHARRFADSQLAERHPSKRAAIRPTRKRPLPRMPDGEPHALNAGTQIA
jgi:hypothetical protein